METINNWKVFCSDVDDTLVMHNLSDYPAESHVSIPYSNGPMVVVPNQKNINLLIKFFKLGYFVIVWSRTGPDWAQAVCEALKLENNVNLCLAKPLFIADDRPPAEWISEVLWRAPINSK